MSLLILLPFDKAVEVTKRLAPGIARPVVRKHLSESEADYLKAKTRILILGAGFGGLATAPKLDEYLGRSQGVSVLVIDRNNYSSFHLLLWTVGSGRTNTGNIFVPVRALQNGWSFQLLDAEVTSIDLEDQTVYATLSLMLTAPDAGQVVVG